MQGVEERRRFFEDRVSRGRSGSTEGVSGLWEGQETAFELSRSRTWEKESMRPNNSFVVESSPV